MTIEVFHAASIPQDSSSAAIEFLLAKWKTLKATDSLTLQRLTEEASYPIRDNSTYMVTSGRDFAYLYVGANIRRITGIDPTGTLLSKFGDVISEDLAAVYRRVVDTREPVFVRFTSPLTQEGGVWQRLILPITLGEVTLLVSYSELISHHSEVFSYLFRTASNAMLVAFPIANEMARINDAWVVLMNDAARARLNFRESIGNLRLSQIPAFSSEEFWTAMRRGYPLANPQTMVNAGDFEFELLRFKHLMAMRFPEPRSAASP